MSGAGGSAENWFDWCLEVGMKAEALRAKFMATPPPRGAGATDAEVLLDAAINMGATVLRVEAQKAWDMYCRCDGAAVFQ